ncbi:copper homeostasis protein CutC [Pyrenochaeta sp. MPI-SDFR-AT-0127]|nr:copper homeostasis protein CutC [Pyrenochaeta sp. MPI-SDFR-AT-0127]
MLEIACFNASSAIAAAKAGANRIELCADYAAGGVTPTLSSLDLIRTEVTIPINVMIRPRTGDFNYSQEEFKQMKAEIELFKPTASGFVFGILDANKRVDEVRNRELVELAAPLPCTFHRAIDEVAEINEAVERAIACGFQNILTSGGERNAVEGAEKVTMLQEIFWQRITFILGGGVRSSNVDTLKRGTAVPWVHSAAITTPGEEVDAEEVKKMQETLQSIV